MAQLLPFTPAAGELVQIMSNVAGKEELIQLFVI